MHALTRSALVTTCVPHPTGHLARRRACIAAALLVTSRLSVVGVMFSYTHRQTDVSAEVVCRMHVTEEFAFLVTKLLPYYEW
jgi:hypothetical protein